MGKSNGKLKRLAKKVARKVGQGPVARRRREGYWEQVAWETDGVHFWDILRNSVTGKEKKRKKY